MTSEHMGGSVTPQVFRFSAASEEEDQFKPSAIDFRSETPVTFRSISVESLNSLQMAQIISGRNATSDSKSIGIDTIETTQSNVQHKYNIREQEPA